MVSFGQIRQMTLELGTLIKLDAGRDSSQKDREMRRGMKSFTLIELLVVISIIILATAMAIPAVNKFTRGQGLENAGRLMQSAFNEARRSAITTRKPHYLVLFKTQSPNPSLQQFGFRAFQRGKLRGDGYTDAQYLLPASISIHMTPVTDTPGLVGFVQEPTAGLPPGFELGNTNSGCRIAVFDGCPYAGASLRNGIGEDKVTTPDWLDNKSTYTNFFIFPAMRPNIKKGDAHGWLRFVRDGTVVFEGTNGRDVNGQRIGDDSLYDRNINFPETSLIEDQILADFTLRQAGEPKKRCFVDIDPNTGRARYRVCQLNGYSGAAGGVGTTSSTAGGSNGG
jgi:type II secretory pathway pseudopilin PulG